MSAVKNKSFANLIFLALCLILIILSFFMLGIGRLEMSFVQIFDAFFNGVQSKEAYIILNVRAPRVLLAIFVGAALGLAGASFQAIFKNPLASPDILGVSSGAGFGAALALLLGLGIYFLTLFAFVFGILTLLLTFLIARGSSNHIMIILGGIIVSALFNSFISLLKYLADPQDTLPAITYWLLGSLSVSDLSQLFFACAGMAFGGAILLLFAWKHNLLMLEDFEARSLGLNVSRLRILLIFASTLMISCAVSICGVIGWVGLIIPHIARLICGSQMTKVLPFSGVIGAIFMLLIDSISRSATSEEIPISILSAVVGALFFITILYKQKGKFLI